MMVYKTGLLIFFKPYSGSYEKNILLLLKYYYLTTVDILIEDIFPKINYS